MNRFQALKAIETCLAMIRKEQLPDGGFLHQSWFGDSQVGEVVREGIVEYKTTFFVANILACLNVVAEVCSEFGLDPNSLVSLGVVRESAARFLLEQMSVRGSFNYWAHGTGEALAMPYPDDLDDTFVALTALHGFDAALIDGAAMARIAKILTAAEVVTGGPYRTWLVGSHNASGKQTLEKWRDIDIVVNGNVGYFLSRLSVALPKLTQFIDERICDRNMCSPYYPGEIQAIYFIARYYRGTGDGSDDAKIALTDIILNKSSADTRHNQLEWAMTISALIDLGFADAITDYAEREKFQPYAFCIDPSRDGRVCHAGSAALTAAFCAEALAKYAQVCKTAVPELIVMSKRLSCASPSKILLSRIKMMARAKCHILSDNLKSLALGAIDSVEDEQIVMVPYAMHHAIGAPQNIPSRLLDELALANLFGWIAYTIYDDALDGEGEPFLLPVANFFLRELTLQYATLDAQIPGIRDEFIRVMNGIDDANAWEQIHYQAGKGELLYVTRIGLLQLADRSLGHALPALGVLFAAGYSAGSHEAGVVLAFFRHYLTARQLHDDAHDWKEDLLRGRINSVGARLIRLGSTRDIPTLQKLFWHEAVPEIVADIIFFLDHAREAICSDAESGVGTRAPFKNPPPFLELISKLKSAAEQTLRERNEAIKFLEVYCKLP